ncbi:hypothetical protein C8R43DRAFT_1033252 [Mycena crocata]|nr:hypothetical protein C8R43DRAFT_1033252 [Mycena crocata]
MRRSARCMYPPAYGCPGAAWVSSRARHGTAGRTEGRRREARKGVVMVCFSIHIHVAFYVQVWCTYRTGSEPIRDMPRLASLPPLWVIPGMGAVGASVSSANLGSSSALMSSAHTAVPRGHRHVAHHSPAMSDTSASSMDNGSGSGSGGYTT